jgi:hypothetical protein
MRRSQNAFRSNLRARASEVVIADAPCLPFEVAAFDGVVMKMVLHEAPIYDQRCTLSRQEHLGRTIGV